MCNNISSCAMIYGLGFKKLTASVTINVLLQQHPLNLISQAWTLHSNLLLCDSTMCNYSAAQHVKISLLLLFMLTVFSDPQQSLEWLWVRLLEPHMLQCMAQHSFTHIINNTGVCECAYLITEGFFAGTSPCCPPPPPPPPHTHTHTHTLRWGSVCVCLWCVQAPKQDWHCCPLTT